MIKPTVGRIVWYHPGNYPRDLHSIDGKTPMAATVAYVWHDSMVNLSVTDHNGNVRPRTSVPLVQEGGAYTAGPSPYCEWMPYQKGQAAKTEALEARLPGPDPYALPQG